MFFPFSFAVICIEWKEEKFDEFNKGLVSSGVVLSILNTTSPDSSPPIVPIVPVQSTLSTPSQSPVNSPTHNDMLTTATTTATANVNMNGSNSKKRKKEQQV